MTITMATCHRGQERQYKPRKITAHWSVTSKGDWDYLIRTYEQFVESTDVVCMINRTYKNRWLRATYFFYLFSFMRFIASISNFSAQTGGVLSPFSQWARVPKGISNRLDNSACVRPAASRAFLILQSILSPFILYPLSFE